MAKKRSLNNPLVASAVPEFHLLPTKFTLFLDLYREVHNWSVWVDGVEISLPQWQQVELPTPRPTHHDGGQLYARFRADFNDPVPNAEESEVVIGVMGSTGTQCARAILWVFLGGELARPISGENPIQVNTLQRSPDYGSNRV